MTRKNIPLDAFFSLLPLIIAILTVISISGCTPTLATRGNFLDDERLRGIQIGVSTKEEVEQRLGTPTTTDPFDSQKWFYIGEKTSAKAFFKPEVQSRRVIALTFNNEDLLQSASELDEKSGREIELVKKATPSPGRQMNVFEQFLSNLGKFNQGSMSGSQNPGQ
jgi:outer membrane protein assembly factor BamE (lipoprotein component of BamABCDE complex)